MEGGLNPSKMLKKTSISKMETVVNLNPEVQRSFVDVTKKDIHLLKKFQRGHRKVILELKTFFDDDIEKGLEIKGGRPLIMPKRELKSCYYKMTSRGIEIDIELNVEELYERLKRVYGREYLEAEFRKNDCDLDLTYQVCVMKSAREFTNYLTEGATWVTNGFFYVGFFYW